MTERSLYRIMEDIERALEEMRHELRGIKNDFAALDKRLDRDRREMTGEMAQLRSDIRVEVRKQIRKQGEYR